MAAPEKKTKIFSEALYAQFNSLLMGNPLGWSRPSREHFLDL